MKYLGVKTISSQKMGQENKSGGYLVQTLSWTAMVRNLWVPTMTCSGTGTRLLYTVLYTAAVIFLVKFLFQDFIRKAFYPNKAKYIRSVHNKWESGAWRVSENVQSRESIHLWSLHLRRSCAAPLVLREKNQWRPEWVTRVLWEGKSPGEEHNCGERFVPDGRCTEQLSSMRVD